MITVIYKQKTYLGLFKEQTYFNNFLFMDSGPYFEKLRGIFCSKGGMLLPQPLLFLGELSWIQHKTI